MMPSINQPNVLDKYLLEEGAALDGSLGTINLPCQSLGACYSEKPGKIKSPVFMFWEGLLGDKSV